MVIYHLFAIACPTAHYSKSCHNLIFEVVKSAHPLLDAEAVRVIKCMTGWLPGYKNGVPVKTSYIFPMIFGLQQ